MPCSLKGNPAIKIDMTTKLARFEIPNSLKRDEKTATDTYARFVAEPFEKGYGHTLGNSLRRVLLSSLEGAAITSVHIKGVQHEFSHIPGVVEDVTEIVLNLKKVKLIHHTKEPAVLTLNVKKEGKIVAGDISSNSDYEVINKNQIICTLDKKIAFECELEVGVSRGFLTSEENKRPNMAVGIIPMDSLFSPVTRVKYTVENTRIGRMTNYEKLILELTTDGRITPQEALLQGSSILRHHLDVFVNYDNSVVEFEEEAVEENEEDQALKKLLNTSVNEIELSVRAANCLNNINITSLGQLASKTEESMLACRNFGKKSLDEIKEELKVRGLSLGMKFDTSLLDDPSETTGLIQVSSEEEGGVQIAGLD